MWFDASAWAGPHTGAGAARVALVVTEGDQQLRFELDVEVHDAGPIESATWSQAVRSLSNGELTWSAAAPGASPLDPSLPMFPPDCFAPGRVAAGVITAAAGACARAHEELTRDVLSALPRGDHPVGAEWDQLARLGDDRHTIAVRWTHPAAGRYSGALSAPPGTLPGQSGPLSGAVDVEVGADEALTHLHATWTVPATRARPPTTVELTITRAP